MAADSYTLYVFFYGLIAFAPTPDKRAMDVFLVDARDTLQVEQCMSHHHVPKLVVPQDYSTSTQSFRELELARVQVKLPMPLEKRVTPVSGRRGRDYMVMEHKKPKTEDEAADFSWVAEISQLLPEAGMLNPDFIGEFPGQVPGKDVVARLRLYGGKIRTCHLADDRTDEAVGPNFPIEQIHFRRPGESFERFYSQAAADLVELVATVPSDQHTVELQSFDPMETNQTIELTPKDGQVILIVANEPVPAPPSPCDNTGSDFRRFFFLSTDRDGREDTFVAAGVEKFPIIQPKCGAQMALVELYHHRAKPDDPITSFNSRPICPMAVFSEQ
jgi:hypothetical protein